MVLCDSRNSGWLLSGELREKLWVSLSHLYIIFKIQAISEVREINRSDGHFSSRDNFMRTTRDVQDRSALNIFFKVGRFGERIRFGESLLEDNLSLYDQPTTKVIKSIIGTAAADQVCGAPEVPCIGGREQVGHMPLKIDNLFRRPVREFRLYSLRLVAWMAARSRFFDETPEVVTIH